MLQLQRASAGSGKTYTLAKKFIWFLIAIKEKEGSDRWRLRTSREIADGLPRILAITFTNKATNEMKQRIVEKLADLAKADTDHTLSAEERKEITYLNDFAKELNADCRDIGRASREALSVLLNEYSDFKVSTIDSFFQTVLRTFAYESNLNDTYQVEIDNDYVAASAVNATLNEIDSSDSSSVAKFWLHILMDEESKKGSKNWNVFQKSPSDTSIYTNLLSSVKRLENEDFKTNSDNEGKEKDTVTMKAVRESLDEYFANSTSDDPLRDAREQAINLIERPLKDLLDRAASSASALSALFRKNNLSPKEYGLRYMDSHLEKIQQITPDSSSSKLFVPINMEGKTSVFKTVGSGKNKRPVVSTPDDAEMLRLACEMYDAFSQFLQKRESSLWRHWKVYAPQLPYLGLIGVTRSMIREYLEDNNIIQLGETNSMLRRIIGDEDAPFIYERLGSHLNHFLIDEFQDTSRLQWDNLRPLLRESDGRGQDNLIIGDAKQSIYRFRNADPSLITDTVPKEFPDRKDAGMVKEENTNWRSDRTIVEFNNYLFYALKQRVGELTSRQREEIPESLRHAKPVVDFDDLYRNVAQYASHRERKGYVEVNFLEAPEERIDERGRKRKLSSQEKTEFMRKEALSRVGPLISSLLERGYRQSDIAILVRVNSLGKEMIDSLIDYNASLPQGSRRIEFISEESLLVSSSEAVGIIINVLKKMAGGDTDLECNFSFYALRHPELDPAMQVKGFLDDNTSSDAVDTMLASMQTTALPALVEAITENFIPHDMRRSQAVFIAALQDLVIEFTESHPADITSFLDWWQNKGVTRSISSPEGTDAIQIMTIHKSKGLEFKCVIIPFDNASLVPVKKNEWKWVKPEEKFLEIGFPPFIPVPTIAELKETVHAAVYENFYYRYAMDMLNAYYVAFTRAVSELYLFTANPHDNSSDNSATIGSLISEFFTDSPDSLFGDKISEIRSEITDEETLGYMLSPGMASWEDSHTRLTIGELPEIVTVDEDSSPSSIDDADNDATPSVEYSDNDATTSDEKAKPRVHVIDDYHVDSSPSVLHYVEIDESESAVVTPEDEDPDPRSEGNLLHSILSLVKVPSELHRSILKHKMRGFITTEQAEEWEKFLEEAISRPEVSRWFAPGWKVLNEREILIPGKKNSRPDRMMIAPDGRSGIVIDYKFGEIPSGNSHINQVKGYIKAFMEVTHIYNVTGYVWYVRKNKIVPVTVTFC